jgi:transcriptional regulator GlxA family with amidase domain
MPRAHQGFRPAIVQLLSPSQSGIALHSNRLLQGVDRQLSQALAGCGKEFSALSGLDPKSDRIQSALAYAKRNLDKPLTVGQLAEAAHLSPRQFSRVFHAETGQSPAKAVENLRVEAARLVMEHGRHPIDVIARQTGFADRDRMRRAFLRAFGQPPQAIRRNARAEATA